MNKLVNCLPISLTGGYSCKLFNESYNYKVIDKRLFSYMKFIVVLEQDTIILA